MKRLMLALFVALTITGCNALSPIGSPKVQQPRIIMGEMEEIAVSTTESRALSGYACFNRRPLVCRGFGAKLVCSCN